MLHVLYMCIIHFFIISWLNHQILRGISVLKLFLRLELYYYKQRIQKVRVIVLCMKLLSLSPSLLPSLPPSLPLSLSLSPSLCLVLQEWTDVLTNAITHAIHNQTPSSNDDTFGDDTASSPSLEPSSFELDKLVKRGREREGEGEGEGEGERGEEETHLF